MTIDTDGLMKLLECLQAVVSRYQKEHPLRTADFHANGCACHRCSIDACDAAVNALPELLAERERMREALRELADASEKMLNQGDDGGYTEQTANSVAICIDTSRAALTGGTP